MYWLNDIACMMPSAERSTKLDVVERADALNVEGGRGDVGIVFRLFPTPQVIRKRVGLQLQCLLSSSPCGLDFRYSMASAFERLLH